MGKARVRFDLINHGLMQLAWWRFLILIGYTDTIDGWHWMRARWVESFRRGEFVDVREFIKLRPIPMIEK